ELSGPSVTSLRLAFEEGGGPENEECKKKTADKGKVVIDVDDDLQKPFKEVSMSPFTRRIIEFLSYPQTGPGRNTCPEA
ncbi:hypothetical protein Tco_0518832, partial [Tanacetum coccineum]